MASAAQNYGGWLDPANNQKYNQLAGIINRGGALNPQQQQTYSQLAAKNAQHGNSQNQQAYQAQLQQAPVNAVGGYLSPTNNPTFAEYLQQMGGLQSGNAANPQAITNQAQLTNPYTLSMYGQAIGNPNWSMGNDLKPLSAETMAQQPGYQFTLQQGQQALDRTAAARGGVLGGGQVKAQTQYATDLANTNYNNYYNQDLQNRQLDLGNLYQQTGVYNTNQQNALNNYQNWANNQQQWRNDYGNLLSNQIANGQNSASGLAQLLQNNANSLADAYAGNGSQMGNNSWMNSLANVKAGSGLAGLVDKVPQMVSTVQGWMKGATGGK